MFFPAFIFLPCRCWRQAGCFSMSLLPRRQSPCCRIILIIPWSLAFLPDEQGLLLTERSGQLAELAGRKRVIGAD
ncbi:hypothetical protein HAT92_01894 [Dickeya solani]|nr:hypothetical protein HAT92_01894 [Dickeya solani]